MTTAAPRYVDYQPKGASRTLFQCRDPEVLLSGPAGTGKSRSCLEKLHLCMNKYHGARGLMVRKTHHSLTGTGLVTYREKVRPELDGVSFFGGNAEEPPQYRYPHTGARLMIGGLDKPTKTLSSEYDIIYVQEATELTENDWELLTRALRWGRIPYQQLIADCNPDKPTHWLKRRADAGAVTMLESRHEDNPLLWDGADWTPFGRDYIARLDRLTGARKERLRHGRWAAAEGLVYGDYDRAVHLIDQMASAPRRYVCGVDWGFTNPGVILVFAVDGDGRMTLVEEVYRTRQLDDWWVEQAERIDKACRPQAFVCDPSQPAYIAKFMQRNLPARSAFNDIVPGIRAVENRLKPAEDGRPRLHFLRDALTERDDDLEAAGKPYSVDQEFDGYVYAKDREGKPLKEEPVDESNHALDALRYAVAYVDGLDGHTDIPDFAPISLGHTSHWKR